MIQLQELPPLSLYVHIPWCVRKCPYCDFNSHETREEAPQQAYVEAVIRDLEQALPLVWGCRIHTVFFGGGTPSLLQPDLLDHLLSQLRALLPLAVNAEITLEANPGTVDASRFAQFKASGVNRLSLGIQSFNNHSLQRIGRIHDAAQAITAAELALQTFDRVNLDLMYALPQQTMEMALADIQQAIALKPQHISAYHLTLEPNTLFHHQPPPLPDDDTSAAMQQAIEDSLVAAGYARYEISAFAVPGQACRHNLNYWQFGDYLGIGAGAHSKLSFPDHILRQARYKHPTAYMQGAEKGAPVENAHKLSRADLGFEFMMNALRLTDGFPVALFQQRTGLPISCVDAALNQAEKRGLLTRDYLRIAPSLMGQRFLNELLQLFLQD